MSVVWGISMVKDEADVIEATLLHLADEGLNLLVADNGSTDGTRDILADLSRDLPLVVIDDPDPAYYQSEKMTRLAARAAEAGARWIVPFDADEIWVFHGDRLGPELDQSAADVVEARLFNHFPSSIDPPGDNPFVTIQWHQRQPAPLPKVAFRWRADAVIHQGNHGVTLNGPMVAVVAPQIEIRHFPYRSPEQFVRKARNGSAAYAATDLPLDAGAHWRGYGELLDRGGEQLLHDVFRQYFWNLSPADAGLVLDPAPWLRWSPS